MKNILLLYVAILLAAILFPIGLVVAMFYPNRTQYLYRICLSIDQQGNVICSRLFNHLLITSLGYQFGYEEETISSVIGKNKLTNTLTKRGRAVDKVLSKVFGLNHSIQSIETFK